MLATQISDPNQFTSSIVLLDPELEGVNLSFFFEKCIDNATQYHVSTTYNKEGCPSGLVMLDTQHLSDLSSPLEKVLFTALQQVEVKLDAVKFQQAITQLEAIAIKQYATPKSFFISDHAQHEKWLVSKASNFTLELMHCILEDDVVELTIISHETHCSDPIREKLFLNSIDDINGFTDRLAETLSVIAIKRQADLTRNMRNEIVSLIEKTVVEKFINNHNKKITKNK